MILGALFCLAVFKDALSPDNNGVYVSAEGFTFTVINPHTIWTTFGKRYHSAYALTKVSETSYQAKFDAGNIMRPGYDADPQIAAQYDLLTEASASVPQNLIQVPLAIPCVPAPANQLVKGDYGTLKVDQNPSKKTLHLNWTYANGLNDFSGDATRVGGPESIDLDGVYADVFGSVTISEQGSGVARSLVGSAVVGGKKYKLSGLRIWGRGTFQLTQPNSNIVAGNGWFEWTPSREFAAQMLHGTPKPSDRMQIYFHTDNNPVSPASIRVLTRTGN